MSEPSDAERPVPPVPGGHTGPSDHEVAVDLSAFLPEGTELAADGDPPPPAPEPDPWDTGAPEPEVPSWALDDPADRQPSTAIDPADAPSPPADDPADDPAPVGLETEADAATVALERVDAELAAVDDALLALDAGTPERSPLLRELLG